MLPGGLLIYIIYKYNSIPRKAQFSFVCLSLRNKNFTEMKGVKPFIVFLVLQVILLGNPCDGQFHWGKNYRLEANTLANLLLGNEDSVDENIKVSSVYNRQSLKM